MTGKRFKHYLGAVIPYIKDKKTGKKYPFLSLCDRDIVVLMELLNDVIE